MGNLISRPGPPASKQKAKNTSEQKPKAGSAPKEFDFFDLTKNLRSDAVWTRKGYLLAAPEASKDSVLFPSEVGLMILSGCNPVELIAVMKKKNFIVNPEVAKDNSLWKSFMPRSVLSEPVTSRTAYFDSLMSRVRALPSEHQKALQDAWVKDSIEEVIEEMMSKVSGIESEAPYSKSFDIMLAMLTRDGTTFDFAAPELHQEKRLYEAALGQNGTLLRLALPQWQDDKDLVTIAVKQDRTALKFASQRLQSDPDLLKLAGGHKEP